MKNKKNKQGFMRLLEMESMLKEAGFQTTEVKKVERFIQLSYAEIGDEL